MHYMTATAAAKKINKTKAWVCRCAAKGRIRGAKRLGHAWMIPLRFTISRIVKSVNSVKSKT